MTNFQTSTGHAVYLGIKACRLGKSIRTSNPYLVGSALWLSFNNGYRQMQKQAHANPQRENLK